MAQMVKAVRMILGRESFGSAPKTIEKSSVDDIEIKDDAPESKPSLEELDALEVTLIPLLLIFSELTNRDGLFSQISLLDLPTN